MIVHKFSHGIRMFLGQHLLFGSANIYIYMYIYAYIFWINIGSQQQT